MMPFIALDQLRASDVAVDPAVDMELGLVARSPLTSGFRAR